MDGLVTHWLANVGPWRHGFLPNMPTIDHAFQLTRLKLLEVAVAANDASPREFAYLADGTRVAVVQPQVYETQFKIVDGKWKPLPIDDRGHSKAEKVVGCHA